MAGLAAFITFWVDKFLLLRFYTRPPAIDMALPRLVRTLAPVAALFHVSIAIWAYGNSDTLDSRAISTDVAVALASTGTGSAVHEVHIAADCCFAMTAVAAVVANFGVLC